MGIEELNQKIQNCQKCKLSKLLYNIYDPKIGYGKLLGNGGKEIFIVAQNPSIYRVPFQMSAMGVDYELKWKGDYFRKMLRDIEIDTSKIYWTNVVKCSTENNIAPSDEITDICGKWLLLEIDTIKPKKIIAMGRIAKEYLLKQKLNISLGHIWHYAYINKNPHLKDVYIKMILKEFDV